MKVVFEYDSATGVIMDKNGMTVSLMGMQPFETTEGKDAVLNLVKLGVTPDEIIKLKNNDLL